MNEDSSRLLKKQGLKNEWSLLVHGFIESSDQSEKETFLDKIRSSGLKTNELKIHSKSLSQKRRILNLRIEKIKAEMDHLGTVGENLVLVGSDMDSITERIQLLNLEGEKLSSEVSDIEKKLKKIREIEQIITSLNHSTL